MTNFSAVVSGLPFAGATKQEYSPCLPNPQESPSLKRMAKQAPYVDVVDEKRHLAAMQHEPSGTGAMAIGEFGGAPAAVVGHGPMLAGPYYWLYEMSQASLNPSRALADATRLFFKNPANPMAHTHFG